MLTLAETAAAHGVYNNTIKAWRRAGIVTGHRITTKANTSTTRPTPQPAQRPKIGRPNA